MEFNSGFKGLILVLRLHTLGVLHVKLIFNSGVTSTYLGCTLMEHFHHSLVPCRNDIKPRFGGEGDVRWWPKLIV